MKGNGCPGSTASGVSTGKTDSRKYAFARSCAALPSDSQSADPDAVLGQAGEELPLEEIRRVLQELADHARGCAPVARAA